MFITFEGPEGGGKTLNAAWLADHLVDAGHPVIRVREPGGTPLGERIRPLLLGEEQPSPAAALLLFEAARAELVWRVLRPALVAGSVVICDRFTDSTLAYQGYGEGLPLEDVRRANALATGGLRPDLTLLLDLDPAEGLHRRRGSGGWNALDGKPLDYHRRVRAGFLELAAADPVRWLVLDAAAPLDIIRTAIIARLGDALGAGRVGDGGPAQIQEGRSGHEDDVLHRAE